MTTFNPNKNNLQILKSSLLRMKIGENPDYKPLLEQLNEQSLKTYDNQIFLPLLGFILKEYSCELYLAIVEIEPKLMFYSDRKFVEKVLNLARDFFKMTFSLDPEYFFSENSLNRKLEFVANLSKAALEKVELLQRGKPKEAMVSKQKFVEDDLDFEEEEPVKIPYLPEKINLEQELSIRASRATENNNKSRATLNENLF